MKRSLALAVPLLLVLLAGDSVSAQSPGQPAGQAGMLYRFSLLQAAPGRLPELLALYQQQAAAIVAGGDELPVLVRHSQGDRWDLLLLWPIGTYSDYYSRDRIERRERAASASGLPTAAFSKKFYELVAWHEDIWTQGPPLPELRAYVSGATLAHLEIMQALAGKREELFRERERESAFNVERGRPRMLIFTQEQGASWDVITLDVWRDWRQYGELSMVSAEVSNAAARKAGFENADAVGVYMRSLIATHHDTLGPLVPLTISR